MTKGFLSKSARALAVLCLLLLGGFACGLPAQLAPSQPVPSHTPLAGLEGTPFTASTPAPPTAGVLPSPTDADKLVSTPVSPASPAEDTGLQAALLPAALALVPPVEELSHYHLSLQVDFDRLTFQGNLLLDYVNSEDISLDELNFRLFPNGGRSYGSGSLEVNQVLHKGTILQTSYALDDSVLYVDLGQELFPGQRAALELTFSGLIPREFSGSGYGIFNYSQNVLALSGWFPMLAVYDDEGWNLDRVSGIGDSVYADMALFTVDITLHHELIVAATGVEVSRTQQGDWYNYRYVSGPVRDFFLVMSPDFKILSTTTNGVKVNSYYFQAEKAAAQRGLEISVESLEFFNRQFGSYPYAEVDLVEVPLRYAAGVEFPGIILAVDRAYQNPYAPLFYTLVSHEIAHQWWYNLVGNDVIDDPWLDEALTTYSSALYAEAAFGDQVYADTIRGYEQNYASATRSGENHPVSAGLSYFEDGAAADFYGVIVYVKGALFFHNLRSQIGDEAFFTALKEYYQTYQYRIAHPEDLLSIFQKQTNQDLTDFYEEWLYTASST